MSFELANFFKTQASDNEGLSLALENIEKDFKKYKQLGAQELAVHDEEFHLQMEARLLESFADHMEEHREHQNNIAKEIFELNDNFMKLSIQLKKLNTTEVIGYHVEDFSILQKEARKDSEDITELHPILRKKNDANDNVESASIKISTNHVDFMESDSSCGSISFCTPSSVLDCVKAVNSNLPISPTIESAENVEIINLLTPANEMSEADEISDMIVETSDTNNELFAKSGPVIEILECKIIKPAGTALPKSIPFTLSPPTSISDKKKQVTVAATISENFKIPQPREQEKFIGAKSKLAEKTKKASLENMNTEFNFESLLLSNKSPSSDSDNHLDFKRGTDSNPDDFVLDFDSNDENNDALELNFIDSDVLMEEMILTFNGENFRN